MQKILLAMLACLLLGQIVEAQTDAGGARQPATPNAGQQPSTQQAEELAEATRLTNTLVKLHGEGKYDEALKLAKRVVEIREKHLGAAHYLVKRSLNNLASVYVAQRKYDDAEKIYKRLLDSYEKASEPDLMNASNVLDSLATVRLLRGDYLRAEADYKRVLSYREKALGAEHAEVAKTLFRLAEFYQARDDYDKASAHYARAIAIWEKHPDATRRDHIAALSRSACMARSGGREEEAAQLQKRAQELLEAGKPVVSAETATQVQGGVLNGKALSKPQPVYPAEAKSARQSGTVVVQILIDETGHVINACAVEGPPLLRRPSERAAYQSRFSPTLLSGQPVKVSGVMTYGFVLEY